MFFSYTRYINKAVIIFIQTNLSSRALIIGCDVKIENIITNISGNQISDNGFFDSTTMKSFTFDKDTTLKLLNGKLINNRGIIIYK